MCDRVAIIARGARRRRRHAGRALPRRAGWRSRPRAGVRVFADAARDDAPRIVRELVEAGEEVYGVRVLTSSLEDAYLEAVGRRGEPDARVIAALHAARVAAPPRVPRRRAADRRLPRPLRARHLAAQPRRPEGRQQRARRRARRDRRRDAARARDVRRRCSSAPCSPCSSRSARSAATPSAACCSRCSCGRSRAATLLLGRFAAAAAVCAAYVIGVFLAATVDHLDHGRLVAGPR